mgnify:CR=1 FL=1
MEKGFHMKRDYAVVIVTYNREMLLRECVQQVKNKRFLHQKSLLLTMLLQMERKNIWKSYHRETAVTRLLNVTKILEEQAVLREELCMLSIATLIVYCWLMMPCFVRIIWCYCWRQETEIPNMVLLQVGPLPHHWYRWRNCRSIRKKYYFHQTHASLIPCRLCRHGYWKGTMSGSWQTWTRILYPDNRDNNAGIWWRKT